MRWPVVLAGAMGSVHRVSVDVIKLWRSGAAPGSAERLMDSPDRGGAADGGDFSKLRGGIHDAGERR